MSRCESQESMGGRKRDRKARRVSKGGSAGRPLPDSAATDAR